MAADAQVHDRPDAISGSWMSARQVGGQIGDPGPPVPSPPPGDTT
jgi:hypothetical protein